MEFMQEPARRDEPARELSHVSRQTPQTHPVQACCRDGSEAETLAPYQFRLHAGLAADPQGIDI
jgi:hypothetical protein